MLPDLDDLQCDGLTREQLFDHIAWLADMINNITCRGFDHGYQWDQRGRHEVSALRASLAQLMKIAGLTGELDDEAIRTSRRTDASGSVSVELRRLGLPRRIW